MLQADCIAVAYVEALVLICADSPASSTIKANAALAQAPEGSRLITTTITSTATMVMAPEETEGAKPHIYPLPGSASMEKRFQSSALALVTVIVVAVLLF
jgi:hypothetical protein